MRIDALLAVMLSLLFQDWLCQSSVHILSKKNALVASAFEVFVASVKTSGFEVSDLLIFLKS
jgi:hypothetical protein